MVLNGLSRMDKRLATIEALISELGEHLSSVCNLIEEFKNQIDQTQIDNETDRIKIIGSEQLQIGKEILRCDELDLSSSDKQYFEQHVDDQAIVQQQIVMNSYDKIVAKPLNANCLMLYDFFDRYNNKMLVNRKTLKDLRKIFLRNKEQALLFHKNHTNEAFLRTTKIDGVPFYSLGSLLVWFRGNKMICGKIHVELSTEMIDFLNTGKGQLDRSHYYLYSILLICSGVIEVEEHVNKEVYEQINDRELMNYIEEIIMKVKIETERSYELYLGLK